ncbi:MAG: dihydrofolate reductase [Candidatus Saccharimonadaceae bacterium]
MKSIVVAYDMERTIGRNNELPWAGLLPADMRHFKELTVGTSVIMGRSTFESIPEQFRPLAGRQNIVLSRQRNTLFKGAIAAESLEDAFSKAESEIMVIGGAQVYTQALALVGRVYTTEIVTRTQDGDAFFPDLPEADWHVDEFEMHLPDTRNRFGYNFLTYLRRDPIEL